MVKRERPVKRQSKTPKAYGTRHSMAQAKSLADIHGNDSVVVSIASVASWDDLYQYILSESRKSKTGFKSCVLLFRDRLAQLCGYPSLRSTDSELIDNPEAPPSVSNGDHALYQSGIHSSAQENKTKGEDTSPRTSISVPLKRARARPRKESLQQVVPNPHDISKYFVKKEPPTIVNESPQGTSVTKMEDIEL